MAQFPSSSNNWWKPRNWTTNRELLFSLEFDEGFFCAEKYKVLGEAMTARSGSAATPARLDNREDSVASRVSSHVLSAPLFKLYANLNANSMDE